MFYHLKAEMGFQKTWYLSFHTRTKHIKARVQDWDCWEFEPMFLYVKDSRWILPTKIRWILSNTAVIQPIKHLLGMCTIHWHSGHNPSPLLFYFYFTNVNPSDYVSEKHMRVATSMLTSLSCALLELLKSCV